MRSFFAFYITKYDKKLLELQCGNYTQVIYTYKKKSCVFQQHDFKFLYLQRLDDIFYYHTPHISLQPLDEAIFSQYERLLPVNRLSCIAKYISGYRDV